MRSVLPGMIGCIALACCMACVPPAYGEVQFGEGSWRLELSGLQMLEAEDGDQYFSGSVEYEFPVTAHAKLGLRMLPLFLCHVPEPMYGAGAGLVGRLYQNANDYDGLFGEVGATALWHSRDFDRNNSRVNFVTEAGIGYKFPDTPWHVTLKYEHISNGGIGGKNSGINAVGLAVGYTF